MVAQLTYLVMVQLAPNVILCFPVIATRVIGEPGDYLQTAGIMWMGSTGLKKLAPMAAQIRQETDVLCSQQVLLLLNRVQLITLPLEFHGPGLPLAVRSLRLNCCV